MSTLSVRIPNSLHMAIKDIAKKDDISINQFISSAVAEKVASLNTENIIEERAKFGSKEKFLSVLNKVPDVEPDELDK